MPLTAPPVLIYATRTCPYCARARRLFADKGVTFTEIDVDAVAGAREQMRARSGRNTVPQIFVGEHHLGGYDDTQTLDNAGKLDALLAGTDA